MLAILVKTFVASILGRPRVGKTTLADAISLCAQSETGSRGVIRRELEVPDSTRCQILRLDASLQDLNATFFWTPGALFYPSETYRRLIEKCSFLIYVFDDIHPEQSQCFELHRRIAEDLDAAREPKVWCFVLNKRSSTSAAIPREPLPKEVGNQVLAADFSKANEVASVVRSIINQARELSGHQ